MIKQLLAALMALAAGVAFAAADANKATQAELEAIKGIGPAMAGKILDERKKGNFKDWNDLVERVKGIGDGNAAKFSAEGLTVSGAGFKGAPAAAPAKKDDKPMAKKEEKAVAKKEDKPAAAAAPAAAAKPMADTKPAAKPAAEAKPAAADDKKAKPTAAKAEAAASGAKK